MTIFHAVSGSVIRGGTSGDPGVELARLAPYPTSSQNNHNQK